MKTFEEIARELDERGTPGPWAWEYVGEKDNAWAMGLTYPPAAGFMPDDVDEETGEYLEKPIVDEFVCACEMNANYGNARLITFLRNTLPEVLAVVRAAHRSTRGWEEAQADFEMGQADADQGIIDALDDLDAKARKVALDG